MQIKNLTKESPRSPHEKLGGFVILARAIDKCRAEIADQVGEYEFGCELDQYLFNFMKVDAEAFKIKVTEGATDEDLVAFVKNTGSQKTDQEIAKWSEDMNKMTYHGDEDGGEWFDGECLRLGLDPSETTLFQMLDEDDIKLFN
ncbi:MAG: DUF5069 domain-containing protein [bacterium]